MKFNRHLLHRTVWQQENYLCIANELQGSVNVPFTFEQDMHGNSQVGLFRFFGFDTFAFVPASGQVACDYNPKPVDTFSISGMGIVGFKKSIWVNSESVITDISSYELSEQENPGLMIDMAAWLVAYAREAWGQGVNYGVQWNRIPCLVDEHQDVVSYSVFLSKVIEESVWRKEVAFRKQLLEQMEFAVEAARQGVEVKSASAVMSSRLVH